MGFPNKPAQIIFCKNLKEDGKTVSGYVKRQTNSSGDFINKIYVEQELDEGDFLNTIIHESLHILFPFMEEWAVTQSANYMHYTLQEALVKRNNKNVKSSHNK